MYTKATVTGSALAALTLALTSCGGDGDATDDGELTDISLGVLSIAP